MSQTTTNKISKIVDRFRLDLLYEDEKERIFRDEPFTEDYRENKVLCLEDVSSEIRTALAYSDYEWIHSIAKKVICENNLSIIIDDRPSYQFLCSSLLKALDQVVSVQLDRWNGRYSEHPIAAYPSTMMPKSVEEAKSKTGRPAAEWKVIEVELRRMAKKDCELKINKDGRINRIKTAAALREWYKTNHADKAFKKANDAANDTIVRRMQSVFDELDAKIQTKSG